LPPSTRISTSLLFIVSRLAFLALFANCCSNWTQRELTLSGKIFGL
jgi:hypothetical protein